MNFNGHNLIDFIPFVGAAVSKTGLNSQPGITRVAEILLILGFIWWQVDKLETRVDGLEKAVIEVVQTSVENRTRLQERFDHPGK